MTVPRRQSRAITVDGIALRWWFRLPYCRVQDCPQDWAHVLIAGASRAGEVVSCAIASYSGPATPARVAAAARIALARGWVPGEGSGEMHVLLPRTDE